MVSKFFTNTLTNLLLPLIVVASINLSSCEKYVSLTTTDVIGQWKDVTDYPHRTLLDTLKGHYLHFNFNADGRYFVYIDSFIAPYTFEPDSAFLANITPETPTTKWYGTWTFDEVAQKITITPEPGIFRHYQIEGIISDAPYTWTINRFDGEALNVKQEKWFSATAYQIIDRGFEKE